MKLTFFNKFRIVFISIALAVSGMIVWACADWDYDPPSNFTPEVFIDSTLSPFYFDSYNFYYGGYNEDCENKFSEINVNEWLSYFENNVSRDVLKNSLYTSSQGFIDTVCLNLKNNLKVIPQEVSGFSSCNREKLKKYFDYLQLAKQCETFANAPVNYWNSEKTKPVPPPAGLYNNIESSFAKEKDIFLKERYWFQLVRCAYFSKNYNESIKQFENNKSLFAQNNMYYRTLEYTAGSLYKQKEYGRANYYYSLVFAASDALKTSAHFSFHPKDEADWQQTLRLCSNNKEKEILWQMLGIFYKDEYRSLKEIYALNPKSNCMNILLARLINKMEEGSANQFGDSIPNVNTANAYDWVIQVAEKENTSSPFLWWVSAGYIAFHNNNFKKAGEYYQKANKILPESLLAKEQLRILETVNEVAACKEMNNSSEAALFKDLDWLYSLNNINTLRFTNAQSWVRSTLAKKYKAENKYYQSECFLTDKKFYTSNSNIESLKAFFLKTDKTDFEKLMTSLSEKKYDDLLEYQAVCEAYKNNISNAISLMKKTKANNDTLLGNPFNGRINDCHDCDFAAMKKQKFTKLNFLLMLQKMENNLSQDSDVYNNALLLGNAFYNMSQYGNARAFYECLIIGSNMCCVETLDSVFVPMLTNMHIAEKYYQRAFKTATNDEQRAKAIYMLAKCERNDYYNVVVLPNPWDQPGVYYAKKNFTKLKQYSNTEYYKEVIKECGYFKSFLNNK